MSGYEPENSIFQNQQELLNISFVKSWAKYPDFYRYSISNNENYGGKAMLMAELDGGKKWYVIGYLNEEDVRALELPEWKPKYD